MAGQGVTRKKRRYYPINSPLLEEDLLSEDERALYELGQSFIQDATGTQHNQHTHDNIKHCLHKLRVCCCFDKGLLSLAITLLLIIIGVVVLILARLMGTSRTVDSIGGYILSAGVFGLASGGTNWLAVVGLFYRIPGFIGSGVFYRQSKHIRNVVKLIVLQMVFDSQHLETYLTRKITHFSTSVQVVDSINSALSSAEVERIIEERLEMVYAHPEGHYLESLGLTKVRLQPLIKPAVVSLFAEAAPLVLDSVTEQREQQGISVPQFREEMDRYLTWRAEAVTEQEIGRLMRTHLYRHLSWIVVWGSVFGLLTGIVVQALHISLNFSIIRRE